MKTDNSHLKQKVELRIKYLPDKTKIKVLDCFAGKGTIWRQVKKESDKQIQIISIEKEKGKNKSALEGDNVKYLLSMDLTKFDIIDLDAYGIPFEQLEILFKRNYKGIVFITAIQSIIGKIPNGLLIKLGYTQKMINKIPSLFNRNGIEKVKNYLYLCGIEYIKGYFIGRKNYFVINIK